jgi:hypothetical protein
MAHCWPYQDFPSHQTLHSADPLADNPPTCAATPLEVPPSLQLQARPQEEEMVTFQNPVGAEKTLEPVLTSLGPLPTTHDWSL